MIEKVELKNSELRDVFELDYGDMVVIKFKSGLQLVVEQTEPTGETESAEVINLLPPLR